MTPAARPSEDAHDHDTLRRLTAGAMAAALLGAAGPAPAQAPPPKPSNEPQDFLKTPPKPASVKGRFTLVAIGDLLYSHPDGRAGRSRVAEGDRADQVRRRHHRQSRGADPRHRRPSADRLFERHPVGRAALARDEKAMGIDMVSIANNHSTDWGGEGMLETMRLHDEAGVVHAGGGRNLQEARRAGILATPKARVALISTASTFRANAGPTTPSARLARVQGSAFFARVRSTSSPPTSSPASASWRPSWPQRSSPPRRPTRPSSPLATKPIGSARSRGSRTRWSSTTTPAC